MQKLVPILAVATAAFGVSTAYLALQLHQARSELRAGGPTADARPVSDDVELPAAVPLQVPVPRDTRAGPVSAPASSPPTSREAVIDLDGNGREQLAKRAREMLPDLDDPAKRRKMQADIVTDLRRAYRGLDAYLGIDAEHYDRLLELLSDQQLRASERSLRCALDPACRLSQLTGTRDNQLLEVQALLGIEAQARFEKFQYSLSERQSIAHLRGLYDDANRLTDRQSDRLVEALAEVRMQTEGELAQRGAGLEAFGGGVFTYVYPATGDLDQRIASVREYGERVHERAAQILTDAQLAIFDEARADSLRDIESMLRQPRSNSR